MVYADNVILVEMRPLPCGYCSEADETHEVLVSFDDIGTTVGVQRGCESCMRELSERLQAALPNRPAPEIRDDDGIPF